MCILVFFNDYKPYFYGFMKNTGISLPVFNNNHNPA
jgi:hypothetical protein